MLMYHCNSKPEHLMASWRWNFFRKSLILRSLLTSASKHLGQYLSYLLNDFMCSSLRIIPHRHRRKFRVALRSTPLGKSSLAVLPRQAACLQGMPPVAPHWPTTVSLLTCGLSVMQPRWVTRTFPAPEACSLQALLVVHWGSGHSTPTTCGHSAVLCVSFWECVSRKELFRLHCQFVQK